MSFLDLFIFFRVEENEPKEDACVTRPSGAPAHRDRGRMRRNSPRYTAGLKQSPHLSRPQPR